MVLACAALGFAILVAAPIARADTTTTINFSSLPSGTVVNTQYPGVTFSLEGGPVFSGSPITDDLSSYFFFSGGEGLENSAAVTPDIDDIDYPTASILDIAFSSPVNGVSFTFDNYTNNYLSFYLANNGSTGSLGAYGGGFTTISVAGGGITDLQINNGEGPDNNWVFVVGELTYSTTPEPNCLMLLGTGLAGLIMVRRRLA
jgi:hypothetical protein